MFKEKNALASLKLGAQAQSLSLALMVANFLLSAPKHSNFIL